MDPRRRPSAFWPTTHQPVYNGFRTSATSCSLGDCLRRGGLGAVKIAMKDGTIKIQKGEALPQHQVVGVEADKGGRRDGHGNNGGKDDRSGRSRELQDPGQTLIDVLLGKHAVAQRRLVAARTKNTMATTRREACVGGMEEEIAVSAVRCEEPELALLPS
jgi:hypothetical protein